MSKEVEAYKLFRQLEAREKRANPYKFYDKDELIDEILKNEDEIERLNKELQDTKEHLGEYLYEQEGENKRLNNIINEFEKWLIIQHDIYKNIDKEENTRVSCQYLKAKDKLQELKGGDKE